MDGGEQEPRGKILTILNISLGIYTYTNVMLPKPCYIYSTLTTHLAGQGNHSQEGYTSRNITPNNIALHW